MRIFLRSFIFSLIFIFFVPICLGCKSVYNIGPLSFINFSYIFSSNIPQDYILDKRIEQDIYGTRFAFVLSGFLKKPLQTTGLNSYALGESEAALFSKNALELLKERGIEIPFLSTEKYEKRFCIQEAPCQSNTTASALRFLNAALHDPHLLSGYVELAQMRLKIFQLCFYLRPEEKEQLFSDILKDLQNLKNTPFLKNYASYLEGCAYFYTKNYEAALLVFQKLSQDKEGSPWIQETALYLCGRALLGISQHHWDGYSAPLDSVDQKLLLEAKQAFDTYTKTYPEGLYISSVRGLGRRILYLQGNQHALNIALKPLINQSFSNLENTQDLYELFPEFQRHFQGEIDFVNDHPLFIAHEILEKGTPPLTTLQELKKVHTRFDSFPGLYDFLRTSILFQHQQYHELLKEIPDLPLKDTPLSIACAILRANSQGLVGNYKQALETWKNICKIHHDPYMQIELAALYTHFRDFKGLLNELSSKNILVCAKFLQLYATTEELEILLKEKLSAAAEACIEAELMKRYLLTNQFERLKEFYKKATSLGIHKEILTSVETLAKDKNNAAALMTLGTFMYDHYLVFQPESFLFEDNGFDIFITYFNEIAPHSPLKSTPKYSYDVIPPFHHLQKAEQIYAHSNKLSEGEAKTLHYLIKCFHGTGGRDHCLWKKSPKNISRHYFKHLHKKFPHSEWTKKTPYYY